MVKCFFAVDLGATSGRTILGYFTPQGLITEEINRFPNHLIEAGGHFYWDIYELYRNIVEGLKITGNKKDTEISTGTNILSEAEDFRKRYMESEISAHVEQLQKGNAKRRGKDYPSYHKT